jgi:hypothetical protein
VFEDRIGGRGGQAVASLQEAAPAHARPDIRRRRPRPRPFSVSETRKRERNQPSPNARSSRATAAAIAGRLIAQHPVAAAARAPECRSVKSSQSPPRSRQARRGPAVGPFRIGREPALRLIMWNLGVTLVHGYVALCRVAELFETPGREYRRWLPHAAGTHGVWVRRRSPHHRRRPRYWWAARPGGAAEANASADRCFDRRVPSSALHSR